MGSLHSITLHRLERISFRQYMATSVAMATLFFCFLDPYVSIFVGFLHPIPLHGLELLSFFGNTWQQFFCFFYLCINIFVGSSLHSKPQHRLELTNFIDKKNGNKCAMATLSFCFFYLSINIFVGFLHSKPLHG